MRLLKFKKTYFCREVRWCHADSGYIHIAIKTLSFLGIPLVLVEIKSFEEERRLFRR